MQLNYPSGMATQRSSKDLKAQGPQSSAAKDVSFSPLQACISLLLRLLVVLKKGVGAQGRDHTNLVQSWLIWCNDG